MPPSARRYLVPTGLERAVDLAVDLPGRVRPAVATAIALIPSRRRHRPPAVGTRRNRLLGANEVADRELLQLQRPRLVRSVRERPPLVLAADRHAVARAERADPVAEPAGRLERDTAETVAAGADGVDDATFVTGAIILVTGAATLVTGAVASAVRDVDVDVSPAFRLRIGGDDAVDAVARPVAEVPDRPRREVRVGALVRQEGLGARHGFALDRRGDLPTGRGVVPADPVEDRPGRVGDAHDLARAAIDGVPDGRVRRVGGGEDALRVDLAGSSAAVQLPVRDVLHGPVVERRPRADRGERADSAAPGHVVRVSRAAGAEGGVAIAARVRERQGLFEGDPVPERTPRERRDLRRERRGVDVGDDEPGRGTRVGRDRELADGDRGDLERLVGVDLVDVERDGGVPAGLVFHGRVEPDEQPPLDPTARGREALGEARADVRRAHAALAGVGVVEGDDDHARDSRLADKPVSGRLVDDATRRRAGAGRVYNAAGGDRGEIASERRVRASATDTTHIYAEPLVSTMSRTALIGNVTAMLEDAGFRVSDRCAVRPKSFDVAARRDEDLLLLKILGNVDALDAETGAEMRRLGEYLQATPMVIGIRTRDEDLKPGVVYFRHGVPVINPDTAYELFVEGMPPLIYAAPGGLYVSLDGDLLADEREERGWSLGRLATELGVSRRTVSKYEDGMNASIEVAVQLEELFDEPFSSPVDVLDGAEEVRDSDPTPAAPDTDPDDEHVVHVLTKAGFTVHPTARAPFKAVSEDEDSAVTRVLTGHSTFTPAAEKRARIMSSIGEVARTRSVYFTEGDERRESVDGTALVSCEELAGISDPEEIRELIRDRAAAPSEA